MKPNRVIMNWIREICLLGFLACNIVPITAASIPGQLESESQKWSWDYWEDTGQPTLATDKVNITAIIGNTATLPCRVFNLRDKTVSWIRARDSAVLAVDRHTITTDERISVNHPLETEDWQLVIRGIELSDEGVYDCQVNTHPKISTKVDLRVIHTPDHGVSGQVSILDIPVSDTGIISQPSATDTDREGLTLTVQGNRLIWLVEGATLRLSCKAEGKRLLELMSGRQHPLIKWTLDDIPVTSHWSAMKVKVSEYWREGGIISEMEVLGIHESDDGPYTCHAADLLTDRVNVRVHAHDGKTTPDSRRFWPHKPNYGLPAVAESAAAGSAGGGTRAAVVSGAIILTLLIIQAVLCCFYIKKI